MAGRQTVMTFRDCITAHNDLSLLYEHWRGKMYVYLNRLLFHMDICMCEYTHIVSMHICLPASPVASELLHYELVRVLSGLAYRTVHFFSECCRG